MITRMTIAVVLLVGIVSCEERSVPVGVDDAGPRDATPDLPRPDQAPVTPDTRITPSVDPAIRACLMAASCDKDGVALRAGAEPLTTSGCIDALAWKDWTVPFATGQGIGISPRLMDRLLRCGAEPNCKAFLACYGGDLIGPVSCHAGGRCEGTRLTVGKDGNQRSFDCGGIEASCVDEVLGSAIACCRPRRCDTRDEPRDRCDEGLFCADGPPPGGGFFFDCGASGRRCLAEGNQLCAGSGAPCTPEDGPRCQGSRVTYCATGKQATFDCAKTRFRSACDEAAEGLTLPCKPAHGDCDPESYRGECNGSLITVCVDGRKQRVDCDALGFEICYHPGGIARCGFLL